MEFYDVFVSFLRILKQSIQLFLKNWKSMAFVAILSQFLLSISVVLFSYIFKSMNSVMIDAFMAPYRTPTTATSFDSSQSTALIMLKYFAPLFVVEIAFVFIIVIISNFSSVATILISVASCGEKTLSLQDLSSIIRKTCTRKLVTGFRIRNERMPYSILGVLLGTILWLMHPNLITLSIAIFFGVIAFIFQLYQSVDAILAVVVTVVEGNQGKDALEKSGQLIEGQKIQGFLLNVLLNLLALVSLLVGYWMIVGDKWMLNFTVYLLFVVNIVSLMKMFGLAAYTVLYCECKKRCGEEIEILGTMEYTQLSNDIP